MELEVDDEDSGFELSRSIRLNKQKVGRLGRISKDWIDSMGLDLEKAYGFEIDLEPIKQMLDKRKTFKKIIPYPKVIRDFSFILNDDIKFIELQELISNTSKLIKKIDLVDVYKGSQIDNAKKSYSISVTLEEKKKTLDEIEINRISEKIIKNVNKELNGEIRS